MRTVEAQIAVAASAEPELLADQSGRAVWTMRSAAEGRALASLAEVLGGRLVASPHATPAADPGEDDGGGRAVVPFGTEALAAARDYAHLTGRPLAEPLADLGELRDHGPFEVLVTRTRHVDDALCEALHGEGAPDWDVAPGVICGRSEAELRTQVLLRSAARAFEPAGQVVRVDAELARPPSIRPRAGAGERVLFAGASPTQIRAALGEGAGLLRVVTHSDGIDAYLAPGLTLCPLPAARGDRLRSPRCVETGWCHRADASVTAARARDELLPPTALAARLLIWHVCFGLMPAEGPLARVVDRDWGLLPQLLENPRVGALLTTWGIEAGDSAPLALLAELAAGKPVGVALRAQLRENAATGKGPPFVLIGDPDVRVPIERPLMPSPRSGPRRAGVDVLPDGRRPLEFLSSTILQQVRRDTRAEETGRPALRALAAWRRDELLPTVGRAVVVRHLLTHNRMFALDWVPLARHAGRLPREVCRACGRARWAQRLIAHGGVARRFATCPGCGIVEDAPEESRLALRVVAGGFELDGPLLSGAFAGGLMLDGAVRSDLRSFDWPQTRDGAPARRFEPPEPWPVGPFRAIAVIVTGRELTLLQQPARARPRCGWRPHNSEVAHRLRHR